MKTILHSRHTGNENHAVNVSVLCCGIQTKNIAVQTLSRIHHSLREESAACEFRAHWCFVAELFRHDRFSAAVKATSDADLIVVSFSIHEPLPLVVMHWMEQWVPTKRGEDAALIALLHGRSAAQQFSPVENLLRSAAHSTGLALFVQHFQCDHEEVSASRDRRHSAASCVQRFLPRARRSSPRIPAEARYV